MMIKKKKIIQPKNKKPSFLGGFGRA